MQYPGMKKVLIVQTGSIDWVTDAYYERYKDEGLLLIPEEPENETEQTADAVPAQEEQFKEQPEEVREEGPKEVLSKPTRKRKVK